MELINRPRRLRQNEAIRRMCERPGSLWTV